MKLLDVTGKEKAWILMRLFNAARPLGLGHFSDHKRGPLKEMTLDEARAIIATRESLTITQHTREHQTYRFDYVFGRPLKVNLWENPLNVALYERDQGIGTAAIALGISEDA